MKKIINGLTYDTETATVCLKYSNDIAHNDFEFLRETLFRTKKGRFFLYGRGGAWSWCAETIGNSSCYGEKIKALTVTEAMQWIEDRDINPDDVVGIFEFESA